MRKILLLIAISFGLIFSAVSFAAILNLYENPDPSSKVVAKAEDNKELIQIFQDTNKKDWIKVANPKNGDVGWIKISDFKGPLVVTKVSDSTVEQKVVVNDKDKGSSVYSVIQYSGSDEMKPEDAKKIIKEMKDYEDKMRSSMKEMKDGMQKGIQELFESFDKILPAIRPVVIIPDEKKSAEQEAIKK